MTDQLMQLVETQYVMYMTWDDFNEATGNNTNWYDDNEHLIYGFLEDNYPELENGAKLKEVQAYVQCINIIYVIENEDF